MSVDITQTGPNMNLSITQTGQVANVEITVARGPAGPAGATGPAGPEGPQGEPGEPGEPGPNSVTSATTSDGTCDLSLDTLVVGTGTASGVRSVALGQSTASGDLSFAQGLSTASNDYAFASGDASTASGYGSFAINNSTASGDLSFSAGGGTTASGDYSLAFGFSSVAMEIHSAAIGRRAKSIHAGASVESDSEDADVESTTIDEKTFRFANGYRFLGGSATFSAGVTVDGTLTADHIHGNLAGSVYAHVRAGETLAKGDPVYISGSHGSGETLIPIVSKADASNAAKMPAVGIMDAALANNANGHMVITGTITDLNTNAYAVNSVLYVATGGGFTATPPAANSQAVAIVERSNTNNGALIVKVNGLASSGGNGVSDANKLVRFTSTGGISQTGGTMTDTTYAGTAAFTSTTRPTSAGTGTPGATSLITRADGDARYSDTSTNYILTNQTRADNALFTGASTLITIPRLTVGYLPSRIIVRGVIMFTTAPLAFAPANFEFLLYDTRIGTANMSTGTPLTIAPTSVTKVSGLEQYIFYAEVSAAAISAKYGADFSAYGLLGFLNGCDLRNKTGGSLTTVTTNAGYISIEIYR